MRLSIYMLRCHQCNERWDVEAPAEDDAERAVCPTCELEDVEIETTIPM
jgi:predicted nucleic acid-binding Zn ribbon protein